ncbi:hypothetical protein HA402_007704 [Bradysia odoriphaga]|nr:hypothetical protein HA402_007704 [Bradysia odoriphaga]
MDGWTLLYKTVDRAIDSKSDVLVAVVHWQLLRVGMKCIGIGDDKTLSDSDQESELLPDGWNINKVSYALRYKYNNEVFVLLGTVAEDSIVFNLLNGKSLEVSNASFILDATVASLKGQLSALVPDIEPVISRLQKELFEPVLSPNKKTSETQTARPVQPNVPLYPESAYGLLADRSQAQSSLLRDLRDIGRNDLDPLGGRFGSGGGMLFDPRGLRHPQNFMPGMPGVLPGARFDPMNPPEVERQRRNSRDFDHFRPPPGGGSSFYDDMFM